MHQIHPNVSLVPLMKRMIQTDWVFHLYSNNVSPITTTVLADFTEVTGVSGYGALTTQVSDYTMNGVSAGRGFMIAPPISWTLGVSGISVYGYFVTDFAGTSLLACARFDDAPISLGGGAVVELIPTLGDSSRFTS